MHHDELAWRRRQAQVYKLLAKAFHGFPRFGNFGWPRDHEPYGRTVRIRCHKPFPATLLALLLDKPGMVVVHTRDQDWHIVLIAKRRGSAQHRAAFGILRLEHFCSVRLDTGKNDVETR